MNEAMSGLTIDPPIVLLGPGQAASFRAFTPAGDVAVTWTLQPEGSGLTLVTPAGGTESAHCVVSTGSTVSQEQRFALVATAEAGSATATIALTPDVITIVPASAELHGGHSQDFRAIIAGPPETAVPTSVEWLLQPPVGTFDGDKGIYVAPERVERATTVTILAWSRMSAKPAAATVRLMSPPWTGFSAQLLATFLLLTFSVVFLLVGLWPPSLPSPDAARANRIEAERALESRDAELDTTELELGEAQKNAGREAPVAGAGAMEKTAPGAADAASTRIRLASDRRERATMARGAAIEELHRQRKIEFEVNAAEVNTLFFGKVNHEIDLLWLVLLAGALGGFLHMAQSYAEYRGNDQLKSQWAWWYVLRPFIGAALALVCYAAVRGGFMAVATGSNAKAAELNPFGLVSIGALVGMFSRAATIKLGEVFDTLFQSNQSKTKDRLDANNSTGARPTGGAGAAKT